MQIKQFWSFWGSLKLNNQAEVVLQGISVFKFCKSDYHYGGYGLLNVPMLTMTPLDQPPSKSVRKLTAREILVFYSSLSMGK